MSAQMHLVDAIRRQISQDAIGRSDRRVGYPSFAFWEGNAIACKCVHLRAKEVFWTLLIHYKHH